MALFRIDPKEGVVDVPGEPLLDISELIASIPEGEERTIDVVFDGYRPRGRRLTARLRKPGA
jgi:hypothetical protein